MIEIFEAGEVRRLGLLEQPEDTLRCAWPVMAGPDGSPEPIAKANWNPTSMQPLVNRVANQNGVGMCAASATVATMELAREIAGLPFVPLSAGDLYGRVSGGRDQGSLPEDNLAELLSEGIAPESANPYLEWRRSRATAEQRAPFRGLEAWRCPSAAHAATAIQMGFAVVCGYWHHSQDPTDADGWMTNPRGNRGGHAVCLIGLEERRGTWGFRFVNSWTTSFGQGGYGVLPESRLTEGIKSFQAWALRCSVRESGNLPPLKV